MRVIPKTARMASLASLALVLVLAGCRKANPLVPKKPVPPGTVMFHFTQKLKGPVEISLDGVRLPVAQNPKKMGRSLVIVGLAPGKHRYFCKICGCHLFARAEQRPGMVIVRAGTLNDDPKMKPQCHVWVSAKAPWEDIGDSLTQYQEGFPRK